MRDRIRERCRKFYSRRGVYIFASAGALVCYLIDALYATFTGQTCAYAWIFFALVGLMQWAFLSGQINVQKMLFGAMLMAIVKEEIELLALNMTVMGYVPVDDIVWLIIAIVVFFAHMAQQMDHTGKTPAIVINQLMGLLALAFLLFAITSVIATPATFKNYVFLFGYSFNFIMIICMETRVDTYKQIRNEALKAGTWNEESRRSAKKLFNLMKKSNS